MPTNTYVELNRITVGTATPSVTFSSIPSTYTDLVLIANPIATVDGLGIRMQFNSDGGTNYSRTVMSGYGTTGGTAGSTRFGGQTSIGSNWQVGGGTGGTSPHIYSINNYANSSVFKTVLFRTNCYPYSGFSEVTAEVGLWRSTAAINSITLTGSTGNFAVGSTFSLYGIKAVGGDSTPKATGGVVTEDASYYYHTFLGSSTFTPLQSLTVDYLVVAGGGGGGTAVSSAQQGGGGGGAGGLRCTVGATGGGGALPSALSVTAQPYLVLVGAGGAQNANGSNSIFGAISCTGGGRGGSNGAAGSVGGSGGGASITTYGSNAAAGTAGEGYAGGSSFTSPQNNYVAAGGGGAGGVGANATTGGATNLGGVGITTSINGTSTKYAGGGQGGTGQFAGTTLATNQGFGGGNGGYTQPSRTQATAGTANRGGGGGGALNSWDGGAGNGGAGGSGIVVIRYAK